MNQSGPKLPPIPPMPKPQPVRLGFMSFEELQGIRPDNVNHNVVARLSRPQPLKAAIRRAQEEQQSTIENNDAS